MIPARTVAVTVSVISLILKDILARDDLRDRGTYPMFLASETTFSRSVEESRKHSFAAIFVLYDVIYVLYAKASIIIERFDPSKS